MRKTIATMFVLLAMLTSACAEKGENGERESRGGELTVVFGSDLLGKIRSCGCSVEDMGGLGRRATYIEEVRGSVDNLLVLDAGDAFSLDLSFTKDEAALLFESYDLMGTDVMTPGELEFIFGAEYLRELAERVEFDLIAANVVDPSDGRPLLGPAWTAKLLPGGLRVAVTGVLDDSIRFPGYIDTSGFELRPVLETLRAVFPEMRREADVLVLICHTGLERAREIASEVPGFDLVVVGHGKPVVKGRDEVGSALMLATGGQGQYVGRVDLTFSSDGRRDFGRLQIVPLLEKIPVHEGVAAIFKSYNIPLAEQKHD